MDHNPDGHDMHMMATTTTSSSIGVHEHMHSTDPTDHPHDMHNMDNMGGHSMSMYFHSNIGNDYVLFEQWKPSTAGDMIWTCLLIFALGVTYEGLKYYREYLMRSWRITTYYVSDTPNGIRTNSLSNGGIPGRDGKVEIRKRMMSYSHLFQTVLHMIQFFISYALMLVFMTYNVYFCISVLIGAGIGYFLFGWYKTSAVDITEHCH